VTASPTSEPAEPPASLPDSGNAGPYGGSSYVAFVGLVLATLAFFAAGGVAWRNFTPTPAEPVIPHRLPLHAPRSRWDIDSLTARANERDNRGRR
jgi:hypothetical protein